MELTPVHHKSNANPNIAPYPFDLDNHCRTSSRAYNTTYIYRCHLLKAHEIADKSQEVKAALFIKKLNPCLILCILIFTVVHGNTKKKLL